MYALDLINARDSLTVASWISALVLTMLSGLGTLLQVDDSDASGGAMILYLIRLAVEGALFCLTVSTIGMEQSLRLLPRCLYSAP
jgi:hypothetical protein